MRQYGQHPQLVAPEDTTPPLTSEGTTNTQQTVGDTLYYGQTVDNTILAAVGEITSTQSKPTLRTQTQANKLLDYLSTHPNANICFHASEMKLFIEGDAAYLVAPQEKSRIASYFYLERIVIPLL